MTHPHSSAVTTHDLSCAADFLDDIEVDENGKCEWTAVANAQTHIRAALRCWRPDDLPQAAVKPDLDTAWQWDGKELLHDTPDWVAENTEPTWSSLSLAGFTGGITAFTSFGKARLKKGDWLVRHEGEIHAVKAAVYSALSRPQRVTQ